MNLVVVSNRVSRGKPNEPMTGGLAAALLPVVEHSGAIWVGSSGRVRDGHQKEPFAEIEALGTGAIATLDLPAAHYGGYYIFHTGRDVGRAHTTKVVVSRAEVSVICCRRGGAALRTPSNCLRWPCL